MKFLSICSGIEAASMAWLALGWTCIAVCENAAFPSAVLAHHYPHVPNLGDLTRYDTFPEELLAEADAIAGGTPCQAFSISGRRGSLTDARGQLTLAYVHLIDRIDRIRARLGRPPVICVWENVPGVLSTDDNAFGCFLGALAGESLPLTPPGGKWTDAGYVRGPARAIAWRLLDAQYFGVPQRRERVFALAGAGAFRPEEILFESQGLRRDSPPRREAGEGTAATLTSRAGNGSRQAGSEGLLIPHTTHALTAEGHDASEDGTPLIPLIAPAVTSKWAKGSGGPSGDECQNLIACQDTAASLTGNPHADNLSREDCLIPVAFQTSGNDGARCNGDITGDLDTGTDRTTHVIVFDTTQITSKANRSNPQPGDPCHPLAAQAHAPAIAFSGRARGDDGRGYERPPHIFGDGIVGAIDTVKPHCIALPNAVRRLTPTECERLQGFPDGHTLIPWRGKPPHECPDGPRYKALGNSWAVPCARWLGQRITAWLSLNTDH